MNNVKTEIESRVLVVDDDQAIVDEYLLCLGSGFDSELARSTLSELENVLFAEESAMGGDVVFAVDSCRQGEEAVDTVQRAVAAGEHYSIVFLDVRMPPGIDGIETGRRIRKLDPNVNIVIVTGSASSAPEKLGAKIPPADRVFYFKKPFHAIECRQLAAALCGKWHTDLNLRRANDMLEQRVSERTQALRKLAYFDPVTGLPNRLRLVDELQAMIDESGSAKTESAVILLDINRFSFLNETLGYESGTRLLIAVAQRLDEHAKTMCASHGCVVGRFGADEFACLATGIADEERLHELVDAIKSVVERPFTVVEREVFLKASIGVARYPVHGDDARTVFRCAESALHRSMRKLQPGVTFYHPDMRNRARHKFDLEVELRQAIAGGEMTAWYQPQLCLKTGKVAGVEALARWPRPDGSIVPPADFMPITEEIGISDLFFETILRDVTGAVARWRKQRQWTVPVSVNLSAHQLHNDNLVSIIRSILTEQSVTQSLINLELTETVLLEDLTIARPIIHDLADYGVGLHIDDFGTGYSSLSYLAELPVQVLKIDQSFVRRLTESVTNARVVQAIIALGKAMDLTVVAEGVETGQQLKLVQSFGCDLAQGYFIAKPMPEGEFLDWCRTVDEAANGADLSPELFSRIA